MPWETDITEIRVGAAQIDFKPALKRVAFASRHYLVLDLVWMTFKRHLQIGVAESQIEKIT